MYCLYDFDFKNKPSFPACGFVLVGLKKIIILIKETSCRGLIVKHTKNNFEPFNGGVINEQ